MNTPLINCAVIATQANPLHKEGDVVGFVVKIDGNIVKFKDRQGDIDDLIWRFPDGLNKFYTFGY